MGKENSDKSELLRQSQSAPIADTLPSEITELLDEYESNLKALGRSQKTITSYIDILKRYLSVVVSTKAFRSIIDIGRRELNDYLNYLRNCKRWPNKITNGRDTGKLSPFTIQDHARTIKVFWGWLLREGYIDKNPLEKFPLPSVPKVIIKIIKTELFEKLLVLIDRSIPIGAQRYCIMLLLYDAGFRISELVNILIKNIDFTTGLISVIGKGNKERDVPISRLTIKDCRKSPVSL